MNDFNEIVEFYLKGNDAYLPYLITGVEKLLDIRFSDTFKDFRPDQATAIEHLFYHAKKINKAMLIFANAVDELEKRLENLQ